MAVKNLVALKVIIKLDPTNGQALYPSFNLISSAVRKGMDWSKYIDTEGGGWHYDKTCGHREDSVESPLGQQFGCLCVPQDFATEALNMFPGVVTELTETEFEDFHDNKAHAHEPDDSVNSDILSGLNSRRQLMKGLGQDTTALDVQITKALDPNDESEVGVVKNKKRRWADAKVVSNLALKNPKIVA